MRNKLNNAVNKRKVIFWDGQFSVLDSWRTQFREVLKWFLQKSVWRPAPHWMCVLSLSAVRLICAAEKGAQLLRNFLLWLACSNFFLPNFKFLQNFKVFSWRAVIYIILSCIYELNGRLACCTNSYITSGHVKNWKTCTSMNRTNMKVSENA